MYSALIRSGVRSVAPASRTRVPPALRARGGSEALLAGLPVFRGAAAAPLARLARAAPAVRLAKGESLFGRGDRCNGFYVVGGGAIKLAYYSQGGAEKVVEIVRPGQSFGEALMFLDQPCVVSAQALAESTLLHVSTTLLTDEMTREPSLARSLLAGLSWRLHALLDDLGANAMRSGAQRLTAYLLRDLRPEAACAPIDIALPPKGDVASRLSMTAEHFSRILHRMEALGLVEVQGRLVRVPDAARLSAYAAGLGACAAAESP